MKQASKEIKNFPIRLPLDFHKEIKVAAFTQEVSIHQFIIDAITEKLAREGKK